MVRKAANEGQGCSNVTCCHTLFRPPYRSQESFKSAALVGWAFFLERVCGGGGGGVRVPAIGEKAEVFSSGNFEKGLWTGIWKIKYGRMTNGTTD